MLRSLPGRVAPTSPRVVPTSTRVAAKCVGVAMKRGQADIDGHARRHDILLVGDAQLDAHAEVPATGSSDPAVLDGENRTAVRDRTHRTYERRDLRTWRSGNYQRRTTSKAAHPSRRRMDPASTCDRTTTGRSEPTGVAGGYGAVLGSDEHVIGGRYYNNRQGGLQGRRRSDAPWSTASRSTTTTSPTTRIRSRTSTATTKPAA